MAPQDGVGEGRPRPKKLRKASKRTAAGMAKVACTMIGPRALGKMWRSKSEKSRAPAIRAGSKNSLFRQGRDWARTQRAKANHRGMGEAVVVKRIPVLV